MLAYTLKNTAGNSMTPFQNIQELRKYLFCKCEMKYIPQRFVFFKNLTRF